MVNAIKFNKNLHKLSKNEMKIHHDLQKFLNKEQDINVLIGSYLSGNNSKKLYSKTECIINITPVKSWSEFFYLLKKVLFL